MKSILIIDDDPAVRGVLRTSMESEGYLIEEAEDGREAIRKLADRAYDLVIADIAEKMDDIVSRGHLCVHQYPFAAFRTRHYVRAYNMIASRPSAWIGALHRHGQPLMQIIGRTKATFFASPAFSAASTTAPTSL